MGDVRFDCIYLKLYLLFSEYNSIFTNHQSVSLCLGCFFDFLIAHNSIIDCGVRFVSVARRHFKSILLKTHKTFRLNYNCEISPQRGGSTGNDC